MKQKVVLWLCIAVIATAGSLPAAQLNESEIRLDIPDSWSITAHPAGLPIEITNGSGNTQLLIFRTDLELSQTINTADELKQSVQKVIDSVILSLPNSKLITNTGYSETARTGFALEFVSADPDDGSLLRHRLMGWLYKHPDGHQILFTLWGKGVIQDYPQSENDIRKMQMAFEYTGPQDTMVLSSGARGWALPALVIVIAVAGLLYYRSARSTRLRVSIVADSGWQCGCGTYNSSSVHQCRKCGKSRLIARVR